MVVICNKPGDKLTMEIVKSVVSTVPGVNFPSVPTMLEVTADDTRLRIALCSMLLNWFSVLCDDEAADEECSVNPFWALAWFSSTGPLSGLPPNDGLTGT